MKKLIVGLGNPGNEYADTRHNIGFMVLNELAKQEGVEFRLANEHKAEIAELSGGILLKPQTFMNLSGQSVASYANYFKIKPENIWIISDDLDLPLGQIRVRDTGSSGGHNGLKSIISSLGTEDFYRVRLGISQVGEEHIEPEASIFVLDKFSSREQEPLSKSVSLATDLVRSWLSEDSTGIDCHTYSIER